MGKKDFVQLCIENSIYFLLELFYDSILFTFNFLLILIIYDQLITKKLISTLNLYLVILIAKFVFTLSLSVFLFVTKKKKTKEKIKKLKTDHTLICRFNFVDVLIGNYLRMSLCLVHLIKNFLVWIFFTCWSYFLTFIFLFCLSKLLYRSLNFLKFTIVFCVCFFLLIFVLEIVDWFVQKKIEKMELYSIQFQIQMNMTNLLLSNKRMSKKHLIGQLDYYFRNNYSFSQLENFIDKIVKENSQTFVQNFDKKSGKTFIRAFGFFNLFVRNLHTNETICTLRVLPCMKVETLFQLIDKKLNTTNYHELQFLKNDLSTKSNLSLMELGIQNQSEIILIEYPLLGGTFGTSFKRKNDGPLRQKSKRRKKKSFSSPNEKDTKTSLSFPITDLGDRDFFKFLNDFEWICYQLVLYWEKCNQMNLKRNYFKPSSTYLKFLNPQTRKFIDLETVQKLFEKFEKGQIKYENYIYIDRFNRNRTIVNNIFEKSNDETYRDFVLSEIVENLTQGKTSFPDLTFDEYMELLIKKLNENSPGIMESSEMDPDSFVLQIKFLRAISNSMETITKHLGLKGLERSIIINTILIAIFFNQNIKMSHAMLEKKLNVSRHFIKIGFESVKGLKAGDISVFKREYKTRLKYTQETHQNVIKWWETQTREGTKLLVRPGGKNKEKDVMRFLDSTLYDFYEQYKEHDLFGKLAETVNGVKKIPSLSFFIERRPHYIRTDTNFKTGFCGICMQAREYLKVLKKILNQAKRKENCKCTDTNCPNYGGHDINCPKNYDSEAECETCSPCDCEECTKCTIIKNDFKISLQWFFEKLICCEENFGGKNFPKNLKCIDTHLSKKKKCSKCGFNNIYDLMDKFCTTLKNNINLEEEITSKRWVKKSIDTGKNTKGQEKKKFEVLMLSEFKQTTKEFFEDLLKFCNKKRGFINHHCVSHFQRYQYNSMRTLMETGYFGRKILILLTDWSENFNLNGGKYKSADQHYGKNKCQILNVMEYYWTENLYKIVSNFVLTPLSIRKSSEFSIYRIKKIILEHKKNNSELENVVIWSDGSTKEFLNANLFGNLGQLAQELDVNIFWNFFGNMHGKNQCDSQFARYKTKLRRIINQKKIDGFEEALDVFLYSKKNLSTSNWNCFGKLSERNFYFQENDVYGLPKYETVKPDTKLFRSYLFTKNNKFWRRRNTCNCKECFELNMEPIQCPNYELTGLWEQKIPILKSNQTNEIRIEEIVDPSDQKKENEKIIKIINEESVFEEKILDETNFIHCCDEENCCCEFVLTQLEDPTENSDTENVIG